MATSTLDRKTTSVYAAAIAFIEAAKQSVTLSQLDEAAFDLAEVALNDTNEIDFSEGSLHTAYNNLSRMLEDATSQVYIFIEGDEDGDAIEQAPGTLEEMPAFVLGLVADIESAVVEYLNA